MHLTVPDIVRYLNEPSHHGKEQNKDSVQISAFRQSLKSIMKRLWRTTYITWAEVVFGSLGIPHRLTEERGINEGKKQ